MWVFRVELVGQACSIFFQIHRSSYVPQEDSLVGLGLHLQEMLDPGSFEDQTTNFPVELNEDSSLVEVLYVHVMVNGQVNKQNKNKRYTYVVQLKITLALLTTTNHKQALQDTDSENLAWRCQKGLYSIANC